LAAAHKIESVAFCCISTGVFHFPAAEAARIAVDRVSRFLKDQTAVKEALFNVFTEQDERIYRALLG
jgi:O-acetyl-ADP-ribose deacetylase (regulator of RNase III)